MGKWIDSNPGLFSVLLAVVIVGGLIIGFILSVGTMLVVIMGVLLTAMVACGIYSVVGPEEDYTDMW